MEEEDGVLPSHGNNPEQGATSATLDPMQIVRAAMSYGRKQAGLPEMFYEDPSTPSFDDGGMVPDPSQQAMPEGQEQDGSPPLPDPRKAMAYLAGDGALAPDIVGALERNVDPDGSMDPAQRVMATFGQTQSPDTAAGLLAHYRTKFNAHSAAARAALSQGNAAEAAAQAMQAFANVPTGKSVHFAPAPNGFVMHVRNPGQQQALSMGGTVDTSNPENSGGDVDDTTGGTEEDPSFEGGGAVDQDPYESMPESNNIEDRRGENGEGYVPKQDGPDPERAGVLQKESHAEYRRDQEARGKQRGEGVVPKQSSFDDGGEVSDDDLTTGSTWRDGFLGAEQRFAGEPTQKSVYPVKRPGGYVTPEEDFEINGNRKYPLQAPGEGWRGAAKRQSEEGIPVVPDWELGPAGDTSEFMRKWVSERPNRNAARDAAARYASRSDYTRPDLRPDAPADTANRYPDRYNVAGGSSAGAGAQSDAPAVISPQEMNELLASGYDHVLEKAPTYRPASPQGQPQPQQPTQDGSFNDRWSPFPSEPNYDNLPPAPGKPRGYTPQGSWDGVSRPSPQLEQRNDFTTTEEQLPNGQIHQRMVANGPDPHPARAAPPPARPKAAAPQKSEADQSFERHQQMANRLFPWVSQERQRSDYIQRMMGAEGTQRDKMEIAREHTRGLEIGAQQRSATNTENNTQKMARLDKSLMSKSDLAQAALEYKEISDDKKNQLKIFTTMAFNDPNAFKDTIATTKTVEGIAERLGLHPKVVERMMTAKPWEGASAPAGGAPGQGVQRGGAQQRPQGGAPAGAQPSNWEGRPPANAIRDLQSNYQKPSPMNPSLTIEQEFARKYGQEWVNKILGR